MKAKKEVEAKKKVETHKNVEPPKKAEKKKVVKTKSKEWEKERRDKLNVQFNELCKLLPDHDPSVTLSKMEILKKAADYIRHLQLQNEDIIKCGTDTALRHESDRMKKRVTQLLIKTKELVEALRAAGVPIPSKTKKKVPKKTKTRPKNQNEVPKANGVDLEKPNEAEVRQESPENQSKTASPETGAKKKVKCGCEKKKEKTKPLSEVNICGSSSAPVVTPTTQPPPPTIQTLGIDKNVLSSTLGPGTLIFKDGRIVNVPLGTMVPQILVKPAPPAVIVMQRPQFPKGKHVPLLPKRREVTKTTFSNKAPIPAIKTFRLESYPRTYKTKAKKCKESKKKEVTPSTPSTTVTSTTTTATTEQSSPQKKGESETAQSKSSSDEPDKDQSHVKHTIDSLFSKNTTSKETLPEPEVPPAEETQTLVENVEQVTAPKEVVISSAPVTAPPAPPIVTTITTPLSEKPAVCRQLFPETSTPSTTYCSQQFPFNSYSNQTLPEMYTSSCCSVARTEPCSFSVSNIAVPPTSTSYIDSTKFDMSFPINNFQSQAHFTGSFGMNSITTASAGHSYADIQVSSQPSKNTECSFSMSSIASRPDDGFMSSGQYSLQKDYSRSLNNSSVQTQKNFSMSTLTGPSQGRFYNVGEAYQYGEKNFNSNQEKSQVPQGKAQNLQFSDQQKNFSMSNIASHNVQSQPVKNFSMSHLAPSHSAVSGYQNTPQRNFMNDSFPEGNFNLSTVAQTAQKSHCSFSMSSITTLSKPCDVLPALSDSMDFNKAASSASKTRDKSDKQFSTNTEGNSFKTTEICGSDYAARKDDRSFMPIIDDVRLTSEFSNDLFSSLQVPSGGTHSDSISPTAAFLLAFPLVSTSKTTDHLAESENHENQTSTPTTILQIGNIDPPTTELFQPLEFGKELGGGDYMVHNDKCKRKEIPKKKTYPHQFNYSNEFGSSAQYDAWVDPNKKMVERKKREKPKNFNYDWYNKDKKKSKISVNWMAAPEAQESEGFHSNVQFGMELDNFPDICVNKKNNSYSWSPSKNLFPLDSNLMIPSTLPTLVGDLALGTTTPSESYKRCEKKIPEKDEKRLKVGANFLSVSQLVDPKTKKKPQERLYKKQEKKKFPPYQKRKDVECMYTDNFLPNLTWDKQRYKGNYSAESLIGPQDMNESNFNYQQNNYFQGPELNHEQSGQYQNSFNFSQTQFTTFVNEEYQNDTPFSVNNPRTIPEKRTETRDDSYQSSGFLQAPSYPSSYPSTAANLGPQPNFNNPPASANFNITSNTTTSLTNFNLSTIFPEMNERTAPSGQGIRQINNYSNNQNYRSHPL